MSLSLKSISHRYGAVEALSSVTLDVAAGEIVCLFGPSGCGKTTLLRLVAGLEALQDGSIALEGVEISGNGAAVPPEKRAIGFVFQDYVLFPHLSAIGNVAFGLKGRDRQKRALAELRAVGLEDLAHRYPHQMSGGQQQRVALARALARQPQAMLLDEPFASIDGALRRRLRGELRRILNDRGGATIVVTHDAEEALALGDRVAIMRDGYIVEAASPQSLFERPKTTAGGLLFTGAQRIDGVCEQGSVRTTFGDFRAAAGDGPVTVIAMPGAARLVPSPAGKARVVASRFAGPGWIADLRTAGSDDSLKVSTSEEIPAGSPCDVIFDPRLMRVFPADS